MSKTAVTTAPLHTVLAERWSPRGFDAAHELSGDEEAALLEAARWAASSGNSQPWRFLVGRRGDAAHAALFEAFAAGNQLWAGRASALLLVAAEHVDDKGRLRSHAAYDTGGVAQLTAQATTQGLAIHQMGGFDAAAVTLAFGLGGRTVPLVVLAVGVADPAAPLTEELAARQSAARTRKPLADIMLSAPVDLPLSA